MRYNTASQRFKQIGRASDVMGFFGAAVGYAKTIFTGTFTSDGSADLAIGTRIATTVTGASGDTDKIACFQIVPTTFTQGVGDTIGVVASLVVNEPLITKGAGDTITNAATVYIPDAPTEGTNNYALLLGGPIGATNLASGVYTPTRSAETNLDANVTPSEAQYLRLGSSVTVSGRFTADPTLTATATGFEFTLPVSSNIGAAEDCAGVAFCGAIAGMGAEVTGSVANNTAVFSWISSDITSKTWSYTYTYQVI